MKDERPSQEQMLVASATDIHNDNCTLMARLGAPDLTTSAKSGSKAEVKRKSCKTASALVLCGLGASRPRKKRK